MTTQQKIVHVNPETGEVIKQGYSGGAGHVSQANRGYIAANTGTLADGTAVILSAAGLPLPATVWTLPVAGDTVTVSYSTDNQTSWNVWPNGAVTAYSEDRLESGITHLKFQRTGGAGTTSTYGVV